MKNKSKFCTLATVALRLWAIAATSDALLAMQYKPSKALFHLQEQTAVTKNKSVMTEVIISIWHTFKRGLLMSCYLSWTLWNKIAIPSSSREGWGKKKKKKEKRKPPDVYGQLPWSVKCSVCSFHTAYHKQLVFHQTMEVGRTVTTCEKGNRKK